MYTYQLQSEVGVLYQQYRDEADARYLITLCAESTDYTPLIQEASGDRLQ